MAAGCVNNNLTRTDFNYPDESGGGASTLRNGNQWYDRNGCDGTVRVRMNNNTNAGDYNTDTIGAANNSAIYDVVSNPMMMGKQVVLRATGLPDTDGDFVPDAYDNCDYDVNPDQADSDSNTIGDACDFNHYLEIQFNTTGTGANVGTTQNNFPVLVRITNAAVIDAVHNGATDIRFVDYNIAPMTAGPYLNYEIERWDQANDVAEIWVKPTRVLGSDNSANNRIYMYYDDKVDLR